ncbi:MAG: acyltransferase [Ferruginibacter sp.]
MKEIPDTIQKNETTSKKETNAQQIYFPELDGLRFLAFLLVFIHHLKSIPGIPFFSILQVNGWIGVDLFFVLSAYLFTKLLIAEFYKTNTISFRKFYIRRIFRIWPIYFFLVLFSVLFYVFVEHKVISSYIGIRLAGLMTFTDNIITAFHDYNPISFTNHLWTIGYEEQFYLFIPLIILFLVRSSFKVKLISFVSTLIVFNAARLILIANHAPYPSIWVLPITHFESIVLGIVIGFGGFDLFLKRINGLIIFLFGILFFILLCQLPDAQDISYWNTASYSVIGISTALVLYSVLQSGQLKKFFSGKILVFLGKRSYGLYIYHLWGNFVATVATKHIPIFSQNPFMYFVYSLTFTITISILSYHFIEKPFLILKKKFEVITSRPV